MPTPGVEEGVALVHDHATGLSSSSRHRRRLAIVLVLVVGLLVAEVAVAAATGSLALLSDAGHLLTDVLGLGMAFAAVSVASRAAPVGERSFGWYRLEILAALLNAALLVGIAGLVLVGALARLGEPAAIDPLPLIVTAGIALAVNLACARLLRTGSDESLNLEGARLEVLADAVGSVGVLLAAGVIVLTGWTTIDSIVAVAIAGWLLPRALRLGRRSLRVLLQHAPEGVDVEALRAALCRVPGVTDVHDLHVWRLTSGMDVASVHVQVDDPASHHAAQHAVREVISATVGVHHATVQVEPIDDPTCCADHPTGW